MGLFRGQQETAKTRVWTRGSQTIVAFVKAAKKRRRVLFVSLAALAIVGAVVAYGVLRYLEAEAASRVVRGYGELHRCLLGEPLPPNEPASVRVRAIQLGALTQSDVKRAKGSPWPDRCATYAHKLYEGLGSANLDNIPEGEALLAASKALADRLEEEDAYHQDLSEAVDRVFEAARASGIRLTQPDQVPSPPEPADAFDVETLAERATITETTLELSSAVLEPATSSVVRFLIEGASERAPFLCTIERNDASCRTLPSTVTEGRSDYDLLATTERGAPLLFAGKSGGGGVFRLPAGKALGEHDCVGGYLDGEGTSYLLVEDDGGLSLRYGKDELRRGFASLEPGTSLERPSRDARVFWKHAVALAGGDDQLHLLADAVGRRVRLESVAELGEPPAELPSQTLDGCRSGRTVAVLARLGKTSQVLLHGPSGWSKSFSVPARGGKLGCEEGAALVTEIVESADQKLGTVITRRRCTADGCERAAISLRELLHGEAILAPAGILDAAAIEQALAIVWWAEHRGGLRLRVAEPAELASTPDRILYDDLVASGEVTSSSTLLDARLVPATDFAVLLIATDAGLQALRITADGNAEPVAVKWK